jgi:hypothetical protein
VFLGPQNVSNLVTAGWMEDAQTAIAGVDPATVECDGGYVVEIAGVFQQGVPCTVKLVRDAVEVPCYSDQSGEAFAPVPTRGGTLVRFATPILPYGGDPWDVVVTQGGFEVSLPAYLTVVPHNWHQRTLAFRAVMPPVFRTGPRDVDTEDLQS